VQYFKYLSLILIAFFVTINVLDTPFFEKKFYPEKYWSEKILEIENQIEVFNAFKVDQELECNKLKTTADIEYNQLLSLMLASGLPKKESSEIALSSVNNEINEANEVLNLYQRSISDMQEKLVAAKIEYAKVRK